MENAKLEKTKNLQTAWTQERSKVQAAKILETSNLRTRIQNAHEAELAALRQEAYNTWIAEQRVTINDEAQVQVSGEEGKK